MGPKLSVYIRVANVGPGEPQSTLQFYFFLIKQT